MKKIYYTPMISVEKIDYSWLLQTSDIYVTDESGMLDASEYSFDFFEDEPK